MRDAPLGLDLGPPHAAMTKTDAILVQGFRNDDVLHAFRVEVAFFGQIGDTAKAARFLIRRGRDFDRTREFRADLAKGFGRDDGRGDPSLHIARAAPVYAPVGKFAAEWLAGPSVTNLDHVVMAVEMHAIAGARPLDPRKKVPARMLGAVGRRAMGADQFDPVAGGCQVIGEKVANLAVIQPGRVERRDLDKRLGQFDEPVAPSLDRLKNGCVRHGLKLARFAAPFNPANSAMRPHIGERGGIRRALCRIYRVGLLLLVVLTVFYVSLYFYLREGRKMRLEEDWIAAGQPGDRDTWIAERLRPQSDRLMRWLILWVYVLPIAVLSGIVLFSNA